MHHLLRYLLIAICFAWPGTQAVYAQSGHSWTTSEPAVIPDPPPIPDDWIQLRGIYAQVHAAETDRTTARRLLHHADTSAPVLADALGIPVGARMDVVLGPDEAAFLSLQPHAPPEWADGTAWPSLGRIYLRAPRARDGTARPLEQVLDHEIVHVLLGRAFHGRKVPSWLQEGTAQILAKEVSPEQTRRIATGMLGDGLISLESLSRGFPDNPIRARLAYAQSADFVAWIRNTYGKDALRTLVQESARGATLGSALRTATGTSLDELDKAWRARLSSSPMWLGPLVADTTLLGLAGLLLVFGGVGVLRRRRKRLAEWAKEEALQDAFYAALDQPLLNHPQEVLDPHAAPDLPEPEPPAG